MTTLVATSPGRRRKDRAMRSLLALATVIALIPLVLIIYYLVKKGIGAWGGTFFSSDPNGNFLGDPGGIKSAILGTVEIVGLAAVIANEFGEAANDPTHRAALIAAGLVLFVLTLAVNAIARRFVTRGARGRRTTTATPAAGVGA